MNARTVRLLIVVAVALALTTATASAEILKAFATRTSNDSGTTSGVLKPLDDAGHTSLLFSTSATNRLIKITYNSECAVLGPPQSWVTVIVLVDGVQANPQNGDDFALCSSLPNGVDFQWVGAVRQSLIKVPNIGTHAVQIQIDLNGGATTWWQGDSSIVVEQQ